MLSGERFATFDRPLPGILRQTARLDERAPTRNLVAVHPTGRFGVKAERLETRGAELRLEGRLARDGDGLPRNPLAHRVRHARRPEHAEPRGQVDAGHA